MSSVNLYVWSSPILYWEIQLSPSRFDEHGLVYLNKTLYPEGRCGYLTSLDDNDQLRVNVHDMPSKLVDEHNADTLGPTF